MKEYKNVDLTTLVDKLVEQTALFTKAMNQGSPTSTIAVIKDNILQLQSAIHQRITFEDKAGTSSTDLHTDFTTNSPE